MTHNGPAGTRTADSVGVPSSSDTSSADLSAVVRETIAEVLGITPDAIVDSTDLRTEYGIDSLELMAIGAQLERVLNVPISAEDLMGADTVGQAVELLAQRKTGRE
ncbi:acyl carrier protein [Streptomyces ossamyceticus]|uniref:acyl carrier protein n=1 Tax=Streptomyces ossamyceticus TaxID=249581 RepID=UPI0036E17EAA